MKHYLVWRIFFKAIGYNIEMKTDYTKNIQEVVELIEKELEFVTVEELIRVSGYSYYHFHRIFKAFVGESLKKYIKRLQLEKTLQQMQMDKENITHIAIQAGYHMPSSFNKAFKEMFGVNPSEYKKKYELSRREYPDVQPIRIERLENKEMYSMRHVGDYEDLDIPIQKFMKFAYKHKLIGSEFCLYTIPHDNPDVTQNERLRFDICIENRKEVDISKIDEVHIKTIHGGKYAVFAHKGHPKNLIDLYDAIFGKWLYSSDIILRDEPIFQKFLNNKYEVGVENLLAEVYVPIKA